MKQIFIMLVIGMVYSSSSLAAKDCVITVDRTPCSDAVKEEVWKPYAGKNPAPKEFNAKDEAACKKVAVDDECPIVRAGKIKEKKATATFKGSPIEGGANLCASVATAKAEAKCAK